MDTKYTKALTTTTLNDAICQDDKGKQEFIPKISDFKFNMVRSELPSENKYKELFECGEKGKYLGQFQYASLCIDEARKERDTCKYFMHENYDAGHGDCYCCKERNGGASNLKYTVWQDLINRDDWDYDKKPPKQHLSHIMGISLSGAPFLVTNNKNKVDPLYPHYYKSAITLPNNRAKIDSC